MAQVTIKEALWRIYAVPPVAVGARAEGDAPPQVPQPGIRFVSDKHESRFLPLTYPELPSQATLDSMSLSDLIALFQRAS